MEDRTDTQWICSLLRTLGLLATGALLVIWCWAQWRFHRLIALASKLPTEAPAIPLLGHLYGVIKNPSCLNKRFLLDILIRAADKGMEVYCVWFGPIPVVFVQKPEDVQLVYTRSASLEKGYFYSMLEFAVGRGLLVGPAVRWKVIRRHFLPMFHGSNLELVIPSINDRGRQVVGILREQCSHTPTDVLPLMRISTFVNVCHLLFGKDVYKIMPEDLKSQHRAVNAIMRTLQLWSIRFMQPWLYSDWVFKLLYKKDVTEIDDVIETMTKNAVELLKEHVCLMKNSEDINGLEELGDKKQCTLIDAFVSLKQADPSFNEQDFRNEMVTICAAGTNSTGVSLSSILLALAWHLNVQEKLYAEIVAVLGDVSRDVTSEDLRQMTYLDQVLKETWRRYTVFPYNQRMATEDLRLSFGVIPAGSSIQVGMLGVHMNPNIYPDPYKYDPERFSAENSAKRHKFSLLPFSGGPRNCIAKTFATQFLKIVIIHVVREYKIYTNAANTNKVLDTFRYLIEAQRENGYPIWVEKRSQCG